MREGWLVFGLLAAVSAGATELGPAGDAAIARDFAAYVASGRGCAPRGEGDRVILTGFGLWNGPDALSYSGFLLENLASPAFWPAGAASPAPATGYEPRPGALAAGESVRFYNRSLLLPGGRRVSACLMIVDVRWDLGGAILAREMERFRPRAVVMTGIAGAAAELEAGALNANDGLGGFAADGTADPLNVPIAPGILPDLPVGEAIPMTWDQEALATRIRPILDDLGYALNVPGGPDPGNDYLCNNISFLALEAAAGRKLRLAGGALSVGPLDLPVKPTIGFFHYPDVQTRDVGVLSRFAELVGTLL